MSPQDTGKQVFKMGTLYPPGMNLRVDSLWNFLDDHCWQPRGSVVPLLEQGSERNTIPRVINICLNYKYNVYTIVILSTLYWTRPKAAEMSRLNSVLLIHTYWTIYRSNFRHWGVYYGRRSGPVQHKIRLSVIFEILGTICRSAMLLSPSWRASPCELWR